MKNRLNFYEVVFDDVENRILVKEIGDIPLVDPKQVLFPRINIPKSDDKINTEIHVTKTIHRLFAPWAEELRENYWILIRLDFTRDLIPVDAWLMDYESD